MRPVILCGGSGTRLWPLSRPEFPKQFLTLKGDKSLLEQTLSRAAAIGGEATAILIASSQHRDLVAETLKRAGTEAELIFEPTARNTAPAIAAAALVAARRNPHDILMVMPSDHIIEGVEAFATSVETAATLARDGWISILGVVPSEPSSVLGYIVPGEGIGEAGWRVQRYVEKPSHQTAEELISAGAFWNAGMVVARAQDLIDALSQHEPAVLAAVEASLERGPNAREYRLNASVFETAPKISFDYAVLERHERVVVTPLRAAWRDVGTWNEVATLYARDEDGNRVVGDVHLLASKGNFVHSATRRILGIGIEDLVIVDSPDSLLIVRRGDLSSLSRAVQDLPPKSGTSTACSGKRYHE
ncbi:MAG: sugar phosphate nucleotidyltransferase [Hyphomicrobiales bacterium]